MVPAIASSFILVRVWVALLSWLALSDLGGAVAVKLEQGVT